MAPQIAALLAELRATPGDSPDHARSVAETMLLASLILLFEALYALIAAWEAGKPLPAIPRRLGARRIPRRTRTRRTARHPRPNRARTPVRAPHPRVRHRPATRPARPPATAPPP